MAQPTAVVIVHSTSKTKEYVPNLMPFHIEYDGPAPVSTYMKVETEKRGIGKPLGGEGEEEEQYVSRFRGRVMRGVDASLPAGYGGVVLRSEGGQAIVRGTFSCVRVWGADEDAARDVYVRCMGEWSALSSEMHRV